MTRVRLAKRTVHGLLAMNSAVAVIALVSALLLALGMVEPVAAASLGQDSSVGDVALGAALATGLAAIGAGIAVGIAGAAAIGAMAEKPEILGRTLIIVGLAEGIAIYGLIISFMILTQ